MKGLAPHALDLLMLFQSLHGISHKHTEDWQDAQVGVGAWFLPFVFLS